MQKSSYGFGEEFDNVSGGSFYVNECALECHNNEIAEISFHIASNNSYFVQGVSCSLLKLKPDSPTKFEYTISDSSARSALMITEMIREKKDRTLMVVIASAALLNILSLSIERRSNDKVMFIAANECSSDLLTQVTGSPDSVWASCDRHFTKGILSSLSNREKRICYYLFCGYTPKMIGMILGINIKTVSGHRVSVMNKIGCTNKIGLYKTLRVYYGACGEG